MEGASKYVLFNLLLKLIIITITLIIAIIPEGLSLAVIYCMSEYSSLSIFSKGKLIFRKLKTLDNLGRVNCLCLEKGGTLTNHDKMIIEKI
jgi:P-type E1-E2 ATPase